MSVRPTAWAQTAVGAKVRNLRSEKGRGPYRETAPGVILTQCPKYVIFSNITFLLHLSNPKGAPRRRIYVLIVLDVPTQSDA